jgi:SAM-dependent methyltransferase
MAAPLESTLLQCMHCGAALGDGSPNRLTCTQCGATVAVHDGIIDFVGGTATTELDNIDYDERYGINQEHSLSLYHLLRRATGPLWPRDFGDALEIGCGTGGLSLALMTHVAARHMVMTDISPKMLHQCRTRLRAAGDLRTQAMTFATYSGTEDCFRPNAFDTCFGTAVVHHITDVVRFLRHVHTVLKPGGCAFFMEPNHAFHRALTATMADIAAEFLRHQTLSDSDISLMLNWTAEVHCNLVNSGDLEVLAEREDKHQFVGSTFEAWARSIGFTHATALPCDLDPTGWETIRTYLDQCGISAGAFAALGRLWPLKHRRHFEALDVRDQSPSYLFWLRKPLHPLTAPTPPATTVAPAVPPMSAQLVLALGLRRNDGDLEITATGWCLANVPVRSVQVSACGAVRRVPIWRPRPDVQRALNATNVYPPLHALCSGIDGSVQIRPPDADADTIEVTVHVVPVDGAPLAVRTLSLTVSETVHLSGS